MGDDTIKAHGGSAESAPINKSGVARARRKNARHAPISAPPRSAQQRDMSVSQRRMVQRRLRERANAQAGETAATAPTTVEAVDATIVAPPTVDSNASATLSPERTAASMAPIARRVPEVETEAVEQGDTVERAPLPESYLEAEHDEPIAQEVPEQPLDVEAHLEEQQSPQHQAIQPRGERRRPGIGKRYVRKRTPHKTQTPIDDLADDNASIGNYTHDSNVAVGGSTPLAGMVYRRSRSNMPAFQRNLQYGQYLEIPKGRRAIFASRERAQRRRSVLSLLVVIVLLAIAAILIASLMRDAIANLE